MQLILESINPNIGFQRKKDISPVISCYKAN